MKKDIFFYMGLPPPPLHNVKKLQDWYSGAPLIVDFDVGFRCKIWKVANFLATF